MQARAHETYDGAEDGYDSSRDEVSSISSYNPSKESLHKAFGSSLSLQSSATRSSIKDYPYLEDRSSISSYMPLPRLSVAEVFYDSAGGKLVLGPVFYREQLMSWIIIIFHILELYMIIYDLNLFAHVIVGMFIMQ